MRAKSGVFLAAFEATVLFAAAWCLSMTERNMFSLLVTRATYLSHVALWAGVFAAALVCLMAAALRSERAGRSAQTFLFAVAPLHLVDYGLRSALGPVARWSQAWFGLWGGATLLWPAVALWFALKKPPREKTLQRVRLALVFPCLLLMFDGRPKTFVSETLSAPRKAGARAPVHFLLLDMLSADYLLENGTVREEYPNLKGFSEGADLFASAASPGTSTNSTLPRLLTGQRFERTTRAGMAWLAAEADGPLKPIVEYGTIFSDADEAGYDVHLTGFGFPYIPMFGKNIQEAAVRPYEVLWRFGMHGFVWPVLFPGGTHHARLSDWIIGNYLIGVSDRSPGTFFYSHWSIPHDPVIFGVGGRPLSRSELTAQVVFGDDLARTYPGQLAATDRFFGAAVSAIRASGTYDEALVIVLSDHNITRLKGLDQGRVPLLIKRPGQKTPRIIAEAVNTADLRASLAAYYQTGAFSFPPPQQPKTH